MPPLPPTAAGADCRRCPAAHCPFPAAMRLPLSPPQFLRGATQPTTPNAMLPSTEIGGCTIRAPVPPEFRRILTPEAMQFVAHLSRWVGHASSNCGWAICHAVCGARVEGSGVCSILWVGNETFQAAVRGCAFLSVRLSS